MSVHELDIVPRDVSADALGLLLDAPAPAALASVHLTEPGTGTVTLGVLGASHVVTATLDGRTLTEQVSCDAVEAGGRPLPDRAHRDGYVFSSRTVTVTRAELAERARTLRTAARSRADVLCASFPGAPDAVTALTAGVDGGGWLWQTWHLYPERDSGVIVETESRWTR